MYVNPSPGHIRGVALPTPSSRTQRLLAGSVAALLTANAFAVAGLVTDDHDADARLRRQTAEAAAAPLVADPPVVAIVTTADGRTFVADPLTPEGRKAIEAAKKDGGTVRTVPVPARKPTT